MINFRSMIMRMDNVLTAIQTYATTATKVAAIGFSQQPVLSIYSGLAWGSALFYWSLLNTYAQFDRTTTYPASDSYIAASNQQILKDSFQYAVLTGGIGFFSTCLIAGGRAIRNRHAREVAEIENTGHFSIV